MFAVALASPGNFGDDLVALVQFKSIGILKVQGGFTQIIGDYFQLAELVNYLAHEA